MSDPITVPAFLIDLCTAAIHATQTWSCLPYPIPDLDPAMQQLHDAVRPLLEHKNPLRNTVTKETPHA